MNANLWHAACIEQPNLNNRVYMFASEHLETSLLPCENGWLLERGGQRGLCKTSKVRCRSTDCSVLFCSLDFLIKKKGKKKTVLHCTGPQHVLYTCIVKKKIIIIFKAIPLKLNNSSWLPRFQALCVLMQAYPQIPAWGTSAAA